MNSNIPIQFRLPPAHLVHVVVPREQVNLFLAVLWEKFNEQIGPVACVYKYSKPALSKNPELYEYSISWPLSAVFIQISFFNHTSKGIRDIHVCVANKITGDEGLATIETITKINSSC